MSKAELLAALTADKDKHISFLQAFAQAPSSNPPGDTTLAAKVVTDYLGSSGITTRRVSPQPHMPNILSSFSGDGGQGPRIIMNGHIDVFPVGGDEEWEFPPWSGHYDGTYVHGRGVVDMKAGTVAIIVAYAYLYARRASLKGNIGLTVVSDEETGGKWGSKYLLLQGEEWKGDVLMNAEPGGIQSIRFGEKGSLRLTFTIRTEGAHGAFLHLSEGSNRVAARFITALLSIEDLVPHIPDSIRKNLGREEVRKVINEIMGKGAADVILKPTVNIGTLHGGLKVNMIPSHTTLEADIRLPIGMKGETVLEYIKSHILRRFPEVEIEVQAAASNPAAFTDPEHRMMKALAANAQMVSGMEPLGIPSLGGTDCKHWRYEGVPAFTYGCSPASMASTNEKVLVEEFLTVLKTHALAAWDYLGGPE